VLVPVSKQRSDERDKAAAEEELWKASVRCYSERLSQQSREAWHDHFLTMSENHRRISEEYRNRALTLMEGDKKGTTA
jgi:hypothetical protein